MGIKLQGFKTIMLQKDNAFRRFISSCYWFLNNNASNYFVCNTSKKSKATKELIKIPLFTHGLVKQIITAQNEFIAATAKNYLTVFIPSLLKRKIVFTGSTEQIYLLSRLENKTALS